MPYHHGFSLIRRRSGRNGLSSVRAAQVPEYPRIAERAASYHDHVAACRREHAHALLRRGYIAACYHRYGHGFLHLSYDVPVDGAAVVLSARPAVDRYRSAASRLCRPCDLRGVGLIFGEALSYLDRQRLRACGSCRLHYFVHEVRIPHQSRSVARAHYLRHRASHVDVEHPVRERIELARGKRHHLGLASEYLYCRRAGALRYVSQSACLVSAVVQALGAHHLGICESGALLFAESPHHGVGESRHGSKDPRVLQFQIAYLHQPCRTLFLLSPLFFSWII